MSAAIKFGERRASAEHFALAQYFLSHEAKLLDERHFREWFALLDDRIDYQVPIRVARRVFDDECKDGGYRILDNKALIEIRINRLESGADWAETPPSRTLRVVGSLIVERTDEPEVLAVESAMILSRQRGHDDRADVIPVRRHDLLRLTADGPRLLRRRALLTEVVLTTPNLGVFL